MHVKKLSIPEDLERFVDFAKEVYRENPYWVPANKHHLIKLLSGNAGFGPQSEIQAFAVEDEGRTLATVAALNDEAYHRHWDEGLGHLLFFEALPDQTEAVGVLIGDASEWLRERGCTAGRLSMLAGVQLPLTIDFAVCALQGSPANNSRFNDSAVGRVKAFVSWVVNHFGSRARVTSSISMVMLSPTKVGMSWRL